MNYRNACVAVCLFTALFVVSLVRTVAAAEVPAGVSRLLEGAEVVVVGTADRTESLWKENGRGDKVIVSRTLVRTSEGLKGQTDEAIWIDVEGGTIDGVTLRVSGSPTFKAGDRAVLFLKRNADSTYSLEQNGRGVLKLDARDIVRGTSLALDDIREAAKSQAGGRQ